MNRDEMIAAVKERLPEKRWAHTLGVMETAVRLAERYGADAGKAELAALLHDVAKYWPVQRMEDVIREQGLPAELLEADKDLWHAPVGAFVAEQEFGIGDPEVLDAIRYHTSGRPGMTLLDKIICLADYMEPGRSFPEVDRIRELSGTSIEQALLAGFDSTLSFLLSKGKKIFPMTVLARNALIDELKR
ncbi:bis(5'-nucleosyl)-tetraphosphatase (symmetrical) YqeK [Ferviditalea candida]|uniref:bis(5'-nucleosyl)-tetraphosphatase (symmetrical) n=1 Tax=Ferviditalea candida TaxID=3108399 RepID=A0ABU5ZEW5_9BACL|nr:bis(5'-nucleosyl)-tetraphosphatase (symmetrical) YqeK [Paenibacillaceae bacterium T2]